MTEDNTPQANVPAQDAPTPPVDESDPTPVETAQPDPAPVPEPFPAPAEPFPAAAAPQPYEAPDASDSSQTPDAPGPSQAPGFPEAPDAPAPWTSPVTSEQLPSAAEDASMREERARRFGTGAPDPEPAPEQLTETGTPFVTPIPAAPTQRFNTGAPLPHADATTAAPAPHTGFPGNGHGPSGYDGTQQLPGQQFPGHQYTDHGQQAGQPIQGQPTQVMGQHPHAFPGQPHPGQPGYDSHDAFEGLEEVSTSRAAAHWWGILICLIFVPVSWYLVTDAGARLSYALDASQSVPVSTYIELVAGLVCAFIFLLAARWSSLGPIIMGSVFTLLGAGFLAFPDQGNDVLAGAVSVFGRLGQFGVNLSQHLDTTLTSGRMVFYGFTLIMIGVISHGARRQGRREERLKIALGD